MVGGRYGPFTYEGAQEMINAIRAEHGMGPMGNQVSSSNRDAIGADVLADQVAGYK